MSARARAMARSGVRRVCGLNSKWEKTAHEDWRWLANAALLSSAFLAFVKIYYVFGMFSVSFDLRAIITHVNLDSK